MRPPWSVERLATAVTSTLVLCLLGAIGCGTALPKTSPAKAVTRSTVATSIPSDSAATSRPKPLPTVPPEEGPVTPPEPLRTSEISAFPLQHMERFYAGLRRHSLSPASKEPATDSLRISWFGDSHVAADFLTDVVRTHLWKRVKSGGPGFLRVGLKDVRHGQAKYSLTGRFRHEPYLPAQRETFGDGVFGLSGVRTMPTSGALFSLRSKSSSEEPASFRVQLRLRKGDSIRLRLGEQRSDFVGPLPSGSDEIVAEIGLRGPLKSQLLLEALSGEPEIFGAVVETDAAGVVLDTLGINGARIATMLAWDERAFVEALKRRATNLVVLAFGTNEAFDSTPLERYPGQYSSVLQRARDALPEIECLIVGPPDAQSKSGPSLGRVAAIAVQLAKVAEAERCGFIDSRALMGGEGSFEQWRNLPTSLARNDRVHLTVSGYEELGRRIAGVLLPDDFEL